MGSLTQILRLRGRTMHSAADVADVRIRRRSLATAAASLLALSAIVFTTSVIAAERDDDGPLGRHLELPALRGLRRPSRSTGKRCVKSYTPASAASTCASVSPTPTVRADWSSAPRTWPSVLGAHRSPARRIGSSRSMDHPLSPFPPVRWW